MGNKRNNKEIEYHSFVIQIKDSQVQDLSNRQTNNYYPTRDCLRLTMLFTIRMIESVILLWKWEKSWFFENKLAFAILQPVVCYWPTSKAELKFLVFIYKEFLSQYEI